MAAIKVENIDDLVEGTYNRVFGDKSWVDISLNKQFYCIADRFLRGKKSPTQATPQMEWKIQVRNTNNARFTALYDEDQYDVRNLLIGAQEEWSHATTNYSYDLREKDFNGSGPLKIIDTIMVREHAMHNDWFELMEDAFWTAPTSSTQTPFPLMGIPTAIQKNATDGFTGGDPTGFSSGYGNVATATYSGWKNYVAGYTSVSRDDLVAKWLKACDYTRFQAPHAFKELGKGGTGLDAEAAFYTTYDLREPLWQYLDTRNDNLRDVAGLATGDPKFRGVPVKWVPALDDTNSDANDTSNPIYGIYWPNWQFKFNQGWDMKRFKKTHPTQHNVRIVGLDSSCQLVCTNRRSGGFVLYVR